MNANNQAANRFAISYARFSSTKQEKGSSESRQADDFIRFCKANDLTPFETLFIDRGKSGFRGKHREGDFGKILEMVENGSFPKGSVLVVENLDRFSREAVPEALATWAKILRSGIDIGVCRNGRIFTETDIGGMDMIMILMEMVMAHEYSAKLSKRLKASWRIRSDEFKEGKRKAITTVCPHWLTFNRATNEFLINHRGEVLKKAVEMSIAGHGATEIRRQLGLKGKTWAGLTTTFRQRSLIGEFCGDELESIPNYYPPLLSENQFHQLQAALDSRRNQKAAKGKYVTNLFTDLLFDRESGGKLVVFQDARRIPVLRVRIQDRKTGIQRPPQIHLEYVETTLLTYFTSVKASDLLPKEMGKESEVEALQGRIAENRATTEQVQERLASKFNPALLDMLERLGNERIEMEADLDQRQRTEAVENGSDFTNTQSLIGLLGTLSGSELLDARTRVKTAIAQTVERIELFVAGSNSANFYVWFKNGTYSKFEDDEWEFGTWKRK